MRIHFDIFQKCSKVVKDDVSRNAGRALIRSLNATLITLIPKKSGAVELKDGVSKIIAKVLSTWLRKVIGEVILDSQHAFVRGCQILEAALIANEVVDERDMEFQVCFAN